jgi:predicted helicase
LKKENELGQVFHSEIQGKREFKYETLIKKTINTFDWKKLEFTSPNYFFVPKNFDEIEEYERGFKIDKLYQKNCSGVQTDRDPLFIDSDKENLTNKIKILLSKELKTDFVNQYNINDSSGYNLIQRISISTFNSDKIRKINYRPFDSRNIYYDEKLISRAGYDSNKHLLKPNLGLIVKRGFDEVNSSPCFLTLNISDRRGWSRPGMQGAESIFPLYLYSEINEQQTINQSYERTPNLNTEIINKISEKLGLTFTQEKETTKDTYAPIDIFDYIYCVLHSPTYREKYKEFIKIDFPRVPFPKDQDTFWKLVKLGGEIRQIHLLESPVVDKPISKYSITGTNIVGKVKYEDGKVFINDAQYFEDVPEVSWNFYIGGYQPAQKWLKDRKDRELQVEDIRHYLKIIVALSETDRLMKEIDSLEIE